jgi:uncharacterized protein
MTSLPPATDAPPQPRWGLGDAVAGWIIAQVSVVVLGAALVAAAGYSLAGYDAVDVPLWVTGLVMAPLWVGFVGVPVWAAATKGRGWVHDFRVRLRPLDVPVSGAIGAAAQLLVVPLVSLPVLWLSNTDLEELGEPARQLGDKATSPGGVVVLFLLVAVAAPIAEELFFRGLLLRALEKTFGTAWAVAGSSVVFGATHFQALQFPALTAAGLIFALLVVRTGRLGPAIVAHMAFNAVTVSFLVWG